MKKSPINWTCPVTILFLIIILTSCRQEEPGTTMAPEEAVPVIPTPVPAESETFPTQVTRYNLGEATILQDHFPEDSRFRNMPVQLEGVIGIPESNRQHPVVLIMHGSHVLCLGEHKWPCDKEQKNYEGFAYLVEELARAGYVALSINVNAEHTDAFGEGRPAVRTKQLIDLHLGELAAANAGESDNFGLDLTGRADLSKLVWMGHSRGAEHANRILREHNLSETKDTAGYGPVQGLIQMAPALVAVDSLPAASLPIATILPACDQDFINLDGQRYYESARLDPERHNLATVVYLEDAIHNYFNTNLDPEFVEPIADRPDCTPETMMSAEAQQEFLTRYTIDFLQTLYAEPDQALVANQALGILPSEPAPNALYGVPARVNYLPDPLDTLPLILPKSERELSQNLQGGEVQAKGVIAAFCPEGYYGPNEEFGTGFCKRFLLNQPGHPQQLLLTWDATGAEWRTSLPDPVSDLSGYAAIQMRVALDPLSDLNSDGMSQTFTLELVDATGQRAQILLPEVEFPEGVRKPNDYVEGNSFTGHVYMETLRVPLEEFAGIDLSAIAEIALLFDQSQTGALFFADLAAVQGE